MNICKLRTFVVLILACCAVGTLSGQTSINVKAGVETWSLKDEKMLSGQSIHPGQMIGFDVFVVKNRALFVPGFHYHRFSVAHEETRFNFNFGEAHHFHYFTIPLTGGYRVISDSIFNVSVLAGGEIHFFYQLDENSIGLDDDMLYGVSTGLTTMIHASLFSLFTAEIKYHYALQPIIKIRDESKMRGWTIAIGVKF